MKLKKISTSDALPKVTLKGTGIRSLFVLETIFLIIGIITLGIGIVTLGVEIGTVTDRAVNGSLEIYSGLCITAAGLVFLVLSAFLAAIATITERSVYCSEYLRNIYNLLTVRQTFGNQNHSEQISDQ